LEPPELDGWSNPCSKEVVKLGSSNFPKQQDAVEAILIVILLELRFPAPCLARNNDVEHLQHPTCAKQDVPLEKCGFDLYSSHLSPDGVRESCANAVFPPMRLFRITVWLVR